MDSISPFAPDDKLFMKNIHHEQAKKILLSDLIKNYKPSTRQSVRQKLETCVEDMKFLGIKAGKRVGLTPVDEILMAWESIDQGSFSGLEVG